MKTIIYNGKQHKFDNGEEVIKGKYLGTNTHLNFYKGTEKTIFNLYLEDKELIQVSFTLYTWQMLFFLNKLATAEQGKDMIISIVKDGEDNASLLVKCGDFWCQNMYKWEAMKMPAGDKTERRNEVIAGLKNSLPKYNPVETNTQTEDNGLPF